LARGWEWLSKLGEPEVKIYNREQLSLKSDSFTRIREEAKIMKSEILQEFVAMVEADAQLRPSAGEFEMAYQARVAIDRIRFAIKATEAAVERPEQLREAGMQLLDALDRLEVAERRFQNRWRSPDRSRTRQPDLAATHATNGMPRAAS
jgi:hypothetical protein